MDATLTTFGERLKQLRKAAGLTQAQLAERTGMHVMGVSKLERGQYEPSWPAVKALAKALGVSLAAFDDDTSENS